MNIAIIIDALKNVLVRKSKSKMELQELEDRGGICRATSFFPYSLMRTRSTPVQREGKEGIGGARNGRIRNLERMLAKKRAIMRRP